jgi:GTP-binding protein
VEALFKAGAVAGATVLIGPADNAVVFDWEPTMAAGAELLGARGTDLRLEEASRPTRGAKREEYAARKAAKSAARDELAAERRAGHWATARDEDDEE